ncbi:hypothetical protein AWB64_04830 [Caballeronia sordidicola]|uniref:Uncharacterized protein n=1 Tax=Caballeronia sordidicola TaxID=196367 RepID=A0A158HN14_CABSO|nr:hypothetical protein [Caballeronia sordidicola]SAL45765.1 hypothetical protein AWB64_04830 [Caballeronia sordidicola]
MAGKIELYVRDHAPAQRGLIMIDGRNRGEWQVIENQVVAQVDGGPVFQGTIKQVVAQVESALRTAKNPLNLNPD